MRGPRNEILWYDSSLWLLEQLWENGYTTREIATHPRIPTKSPNTVREKLKSLGYDTNRDSSRKNKRIPVSQERLRRWITWWGLGWDEEVVEEMTHILETYEKKSYASKRREQSGSIIDLSERKGLTKERK